MLDWRRILAAQRGHIDQQFQNGDWHIQRNSQEGGGLQRAISTSETSGISITSSAPLSDGSVELEVNLIGNVTPVQLQNFLRSFHNDRALWQEISTSRRRQYQPQQEQQQEQQQQRQGGGAIGVEGRQDSGDAEGIVGVTTVPSEESFVDNIPTATPVISNAMTVLVEEEHGSPEPEGENDDKDGVVVSQEEDEDGDVFVPEDEDDSEIEGMSEMAASLSSRSHKRGDGSRHSTGKNSSEQGQVPSRLSLNRNRSGGGSLMDGIWQPSGESVVSRTSQGVVGCVSGASVASNRSFTARYNNNLDLPKAFTIVSNNCEMPELSRAISAMSSQPSSSPQDVVVARVRRQAEEVQVFYSTESRSASQPSERTSSRRRKKKKRPNLYCFTNFLLMVLASVLVGAIIGLSIPIKDPPLATPSAHPSPVISEAPSASPTSGPAPETTDPDGGATVPEASRMRVVRMTRFDLHLTALPRGELSGDEHTKVRGEETLYHRGLQSSLPGVDSDRWLPLTNGISRFLKLQVNDILNRAENQLISVNSIVLEPINMTVSANTGDNWRRRTALNTSIEVVASVGDAFDNVPKSGEKCNITFRFSGDAIFRQIIHRNGKATIPTEQTLRDMQESAFTQKQSLLREVRKAMEDEFSPDIRVIRVTADLVEARGTKVGKKNGVRGGEVGRRNGNDADSDVSHTSLGIAAIVMATVAIMMLLGVAASSVRKSRRRNGAFRVLRNRR